MRVAFFLRAYNDIDHFAPIIWKCVKKGDNPLVVFTTDIDFKNDYRIKFLQKEGNIEIFQFLDKDYVRQPKRPYFFKKIYNLKRNPSRIIGKIYRKLFFNCYKEIKFLREKNISACVFEWSTPYSRGIIHEKFFKAAKGIGVTTFCIPHGCNIYKDSDVTQGYTDTIKKGVIPDQRFRNEYDYYVFQNPLRRDGWVKWGYDPIKTRAWGSSRFYPEWQKINLKICPEISLAKDSQNKIKIVFMDHQKDYNVKVEKIWNLLDRIANNKNFFLVIKKSTRADKDYHSRSFIAKYKKSINVEFVSNENHSPKLIKWSDCVINFGSSIGLEVLLQDKLLINPFYLHSNKTLFEYFNAALNAKSEDEVINFLNSIKNNSVSSISIQNKNKLFKEIIYAGNEEYNVLDKYYLNIKSNKLSY